MTVEDLLRESLLAHESLADPRRAQEIARTAAPRARRWPAVVAAAASVALLAAGATYLSTRASGTPTVQHGPSVAPSSSSDTVSRPASSKAAALRESARLLAQVPLPAGSTPVASSDLAEPGFSILGTDPSLTLSGEWNVPMSPGDFGTYVASHRPDGLSASLPHASGSSGGLGVNGKDAVTPDVLQLTGRGTASYANPTLVVRYAQIAPGTTRVRADTFIASRLARNPRTRLTGSVTSIDISGSAISSGPVAPETVAPPSSAHILTRRIIRRLTTSFDGLYGSSVDVWAAPCPLSPSATRGHITFHTTRGDVSATIYPGCVPAMIVYRDGRRLAPTLDPGGFASLVSLFTHEPAVTPLPLGPSSTFRPAPSASPVS